MVRKENARQHVVINELLPARSVIKSKDYFQSNVTAHIQLLARESEIDFSDVLAFTQSSPFILTDRKHQAVRKLLGDFFTVSASEAWQNTARSCVEQCLSQLACSTEPDLVTDFSEPLFTLFTAQFIGLKKENAKELLRQVKTLRHIVEPLLSIRSVLAIQTEAKDLLKHIEESFHQRFNSRPRSLIQMFNEDDVLGFSQYELLVITANICIASLTTSETLANILAHLLKEEKNEVDRMKNSDWVDEHVEKLIRLYSSAKHIGRTSKKDQTLQGCPIAAGDLVMVDIPSANRDPSIFSTTHNEKLHLSFGAGVHTCVGANLARMLIRTAIPMLMNRFDSLQLNDEETKWEDSFMVHTVTSLPCRL